MKTKDTMQNL